MPAKKKNRPCVACIYLDAPITIKGIQIHLTPYGCRYYLDHYNTLLQHTKNKEHHPHITRLRDNCKLYLELYKK